MTTPAGWFPDPDDPTQQRYWDGQAWTDNRMPLPPPPPVNPPPPPQTAHAAPEQPQTYGGHSRTTWVIVAVVVSALLVVAGISSLFGGDDSPDAANVDASSSPSPSYKSTLPAVKPEWEETVTNIVPLNPATVKMFFRVENIGKASGTPKCTLDVRDPGYNYTGFTFINAKDPIKPGKYANFTATITVTNEGATYVTRGTAKCTTRPGK